MPGIQRTLSDCNVDINDNKNLDYRKIKNFMRKHSSTIGDDHRLRLKLQQLFYYDIDGIPIAILKPKDKINMDDYPYYFFNKTREEIIEIYNKEVKCKNKSELKIYTDEELKHYDIKENICLDISLKTFRPVYKDNWKKISEEVNEVSFDKQKSFYADYLRCYLKLKNFPTFGEFIKFIYYKYQMPVHKDIRIVFENIEKSYKDVKDYIKNNKMTFQEISRVIKLSTTISNRLLIETFELKNLVSS
jgi:hypothetical protein